MTLCHGLPRISSSSNVLPGQEYNYVDDWGEQMNDKSTSVVVILDWISEDLQGNFKVSSYKSPFWCSYLLKFSFSKKGKKNWRCRP